VSDIDIALVDSLKVLDPKRPIREADIALSAFLDIANMGIGRTLRGALI
jgi:hypothetical protein